MARTKSQLAALAPDVKLNPELEETQKLMALRQQEVIAQFGDGLPFDPPRYEDKIRGHLSRSAEEMLAAGRALIVTKEHLPHGEWANFLGRLGLDQDLANRMRNAAVKFSNPATSRNLIEAAGNKSKLFELMVLDDDDITELNNGGSVAGLELDEIARMPVSELRKALREARETNAAQQRVLADKNEKIDTLSTKLEKKSRIQPPKPDEEVKKLRAEVTALSTEAESAITVRLFSAFETLCAYCAENQIDTPKDFMAGLVCELEYAARSLRSTFDLPDTSTGNAAPAWLTEPVPEIDRQEA